MDRNQVVFLILSFLLIFGYYFLIYPKLNPVNQTPTQSTENIATEQDLEQTPEMETQSKEEQGLPGKKNFDIKTSINPEKKYDFKKEKNSISLTTKGGEFEELTINERDNLVIKTPETKFLSTEYYETNTGYVENSHPIDFAVNNEPDENSISLSKIFYDSASKEVEISKNIVFETSNKMNVTISIKGLQNNIPRFDDNLVISLFSFNGNIGPKELLTNKYNKQEISYYYAKKFNMVKLNKKGFSTIPDFNWISIQNLYFTIIIEKVNANNANALAILNQNNTQTMIVKANALDLVENVYKFNVYFMPKDRKMLSSYNKTFLSIKNRFGILNPLVIAFEYILSFLYSLIKNWGVAIIFLSIIIKALLFPLSRQSTVSMKKISQLNPEIKEIQEKYKDNPQKANAEMQALYKREKINPLSGCLPLLIQFPFLIALYNALLYNIELRGSSFLWIKDLSLGDSILHLSFKIPLIGSDIRLLPIIMLLSQLGQTFFQAKSQVASTKEQQMQTKLMTWLFPIVFFFVLYNMPAGLILYWTCLNILQILETLVVSAFEGRKNLVKSTK